MTNLIFDLLIMVSLGGFIFIIARTLPRVKSENIDDSDMKIPAVVVYIEKMDKKFHAFSEKFLRRIRLLILKIDNLLSDKLASFKKKEMNSKLEFELDIEETEDGVELTETVIIEETVDTEDFIESEEEEK